MAYGGEYETPSEPGQPGNPQAGGGGDLSYEFLGFDANNKDVYRGSDGRLYTGDPNGMNGMGLYYGPGVEPDYQQPIGAPPPLAPTPPLYGGDPQPGYEFPTAPVAPVAPEAPTPAPPQVPAGPSVPVGLPAPPPSADPPAGPTFNPNDDAFGYEVPTAPGFEVPGYTPPPAFAPPTFTPPPAFAYEAFQLPDAQGALQDPGYQFRLKQGEQALLNNRAARGLLSTGGTLKDFVGYNQNFATQEYGNVLDRAADVYKTNRGHAVDLYNQNYKTQYVDPFEANYKTQADAYEQNYRTQYADPYEARYKAASDVHAAKMTEWQQRLQDLQHQADERRRYAWLLANG